MIRDPLHERLTGSLDALAQRSEPRGAATVLDGARGVARVRRRRRRAGAAMLGVAGVLVVAVGLTSLGGGDTVETEGAPAGDPAPTRPTVTAPETTLPPSTDAAPGTGSTTTTATPTTTTATSPVPGGTDAEPTRPGPATTGPTADPSTLRRVTPAEVEAMMRPGAVIEGVDITGGNLDVVADDVTLRNFRLDGGGGPYGIRSTGGRTGFVAEDGEITNTSSAGFYGSGATLRRLDVHDSDNAAFKLITGVTIEGSWWHHLGRGGGSGIGIQLEDDAGGTHAFRANHCELPVGVEAPYSSDFCLLVDGGAPWTVTVEGNWFDGGNRSTIDCDGAAGVTVTGNRFGRRLGGTVPVMRCPSSSANVWDDTGAPVP